MDGCDSERSEKASRVMIWSRGHDDGTQYREGIAMRCVAIEGEWWLSVRSLERAMTVVCKDENRESMIRPNKPYRRAA